MNKPTTKRFNSCYISDVEITDDSIILKDCGNKVFVVSKSDVELVKQFKEWFETVYMSCIPQVLTIFEYEILEKNEYEVIQNVKKIIFKNPKMNGSDS